MLEIMPEEDALDKDSLQKISNLVHFPDRKIQEEAGMFLMLNSDSIDDPSALL
jgi:hypothetical protein